MNERAKLLHSLTIERADAKVSPPRRRLWPVVAATSFGVIVVMVGLVWYFAPELASLRPVEQAAAVASASSPPPSATVPAAEATRSGGLVASGYVVARRKATVASEITGKVVEVLIDEGNVVQAGDQLARLDSTLTESDLNLAKSRAVASEAAANAIAADLRDAERILARIQALQQKNFATEADLTKADARVAVLRAQQAQAQAQVQTARLDAKRASEVLAQHHIRAPFAGVVVERSAQPGEMISPISAGGGYTRTGICTIVDMDSIEVEVDVNEAFIGRVRAGGAVSAVLDAYPEWTIPASVIAIVPTANREKATVKVRIGFKQKDPRILPDMGIKVTFLDETDGGTSSVETSSAH
jgi:RND family efflux transporter MFP subunit